MFPNKGMENFRTVSSYECAYHRPKLSPQHCERSFRDQLSPPRKDPLQPK